MNGVRLYEDRPNGLLDRSSAVVWAMDGDARRWRALQQQRRAAEIREVDQREAYSRHVAALGERQLRLLHDVVPKIAALAAAAGHGVWLGRNTTFWQEHRPIELADAFGNEKTGFGCPIWTGPSPLNLRLTAVICPLPTGSLPVWDAVGRPAG